MPLHLYAEPRNAHLWRNTTVAISGRGAALGRYVRAGNIYVLVRDFSCPEGTRAARAMAGLDRFGRHSPDCVAPPPGARVHAYIEHPCERIVTLWQARLMSPEFQAIYPHRLGQPRSLGEFTRWIMTLDPLAADELLRPQWAMIPDDADTERLSYNVEPLSSYVSDIIRELYHDDFALWDSARP